MEKTTRADIRRLLKTFGIQADEAITAHLARNPDIGSLRLRVTLEDLTDYEAATPEESLTVQVEGDVQGEG